MFEKVLVPTDFSEYAHKTMECVIEIPGIREVILLHVTGGGKSDGKAWVAGKESDSPSDQAWNHLLQEKKYLEERRISARIRIVNSEDGDITAAILGCAKEYDASLIMIGARGKGILDGFLLGSVSSGVLGNAGTDVLITRYRPMAKKAMQKKEHAIEGYPGPLFRKILIPLDFSRSSTEGVEFLRDIGDIGEILLLYVIPRTESGNDLEARMKEAYMRLFSLKNELDFGNVSVSIHIRFGPPAEEICNLAEEENATMIVISRFGSTGGKGNIPMGNTVSNVAKRAKRPVLIRYPLVTPQVTARELNASEIPMAEEIWIQYNRQRVDRRTDRIFGVFLDDTLTCVARCRRHPDGLSVDAVYTLDEYRGRGYATKVIDALVGSCGAETLYMYSTPGLVEFYKLYGFIPINVAEIPRNIKDGIISLLGETESAESVPMMRKPGPLGEG